MTTTIATTSLEEIEGKLERFQELINTKEKWDPIRARSLLETIEHQCSLHALECPTHKLELRRIKRELKEARVRYDQRQTQLELFQDVNREHKVDVKQSQDDLMKSGLKTQESSRDSLKRTEKMIQDAKEIGVDINQKLAEDTEKIAKMDDHLDGIGTTLDRTKKTISRIARKIATDKVVWFFVMLILVAIILIVLKKYNYI